MFVLWKKLNFKDDDKKVKYYTWLPSYSVLKALFDYTSEDLWLPGTITFVFEQLAMVLMKLLLNLGDQDHFQVTQSTVSRYFNHWLDVLHTCLLCLVNMAREGSTCENNGYGIL